MNPLSRRLLLMMAGALACSSGRTNMTVPPPPPTNSVLERNNHPTRDGHFVQPTLTRAAAATMLIDFRFQPRIPTGLWTSPLYLEDGPGGQGLFFATTVANDVFALDEITGAIVWMRNVGSAAPTNGVECGLIHPLGILGTPVIDAAARTIYVAGAVGQNVIERHEVHALSVDDGSERPGWPVDVSRIRAGPIAFVSAAQNQRGALSLVRDILYVPYGGHNGDCGLYRGWVVAIDTKDPTRIGAWVTAGEGEGIWAAGGMASDGTSIFAITGNNTSGATNHLDSEEVVRLTGLAAFDRKNQNLFYPAHWRTMDAIDSDFGANSPVVIDVPGARPSKMVAAVAKDAHFYLLDAQNLGGMGGAVVDLPIGSGNNVRTVPAAYTSSTGVHVVLGVNDSSLCPGGVTGEVIMSILIPAGAPPQPQIAWCVPAMGRATPIATTTDGKSDAIVWFMSSQSILGVDGDTGEILFDGVNQPCGPVRQWTSPIAVKGRIVVGVDTAFCAWAPR